MLNSIIKSLLVLGAILTIAANVGCAAVAPMAVEASGPVSDVATMCDSADPATFDACDAVAADHCGAIGEANGLQAHESPVVDDGFTCVTSASDDGGCPMTADAFASNGDAYCAWDVSWCEVDSPDCV